MNRELFIQKLRSIQSNLEAQQSTPMREGIVRIGEGQVNIQYQVFNKYSRSKHGIQKRQGTFVIEHDA
jgi:hypothetical protein